MNTTLAEVASYVRANVLPSRRVRPSPSSGRFVARAGGVAYSPASSDPLQASGGFNSVIELAAETCRQQAGRAIHPTFLDRAITAGELADLVGAAAPAGRVAQLPAATALLAGQDYRGFRLSLTLAGLTFDDAQTATLSFQVTVSFVHRAPSLPEVPTLTERPGLDLAGPIEVLNAIPGVTRLGGLVELPAISRMMAVAASAPPDAAGSSAGSWRDFFPPAAAVPGAQDLRSVVIGSFVAELRAPLIHRDEADRCRTRVFADLRRAAWTESLPPRPAAGQPLGDVLLVHDAFFRNWIAGATWLLNASLDLPLTPTLSLVGPNTGGAPVPEITDFEVHASAVFDASGFEPALAVAFDTLPGCHGIVEDIRHFIGPNPFGVISDEFVVDQVFRHRWNRGGFDRRLSSQAPVQVKVNRGGQERIEDAIVFGHQDLLTLDYAAITTDSNTRSDCITLGGQAQAVVTSVLMVADGQMLTSSQVDLGPAEPMSWGVNAAIALSGALDADPEIRDFQLRAQTDGAHPISWPFAFANPGQPPAVTYARVDGVSRYVFFLGNPPVALD